MRKVFLILALCLIIQSCTAMTPWGNLSDAGNRIIAIQTAEMNIITVRTDGPEAEARLEKIMGYVRDVFNKSRETQK